jgi:hypothetical protein
MYLHTQRSLFRVDQARGLKLKSSGALIIDRRKL